MCQLAKPKWAPGSTCLVTRDYLVSGLNALPPPLRLWAASGRSGAWVGRRHRLVGSGNSSCPRLHTGSGLVPSSEAPRSESRISSSTAVAPSLSENCVSTPSTKARSSRQGTPARSGAREFGPPRWVVGPARRRGSDGGRVRTRKGRSQQPAVDLQPPDSSLQPPASSLKESSLLPQRAEQAAQDFCRFGGLRCELLVRLFAQVAETVGKRKLVLDLTRRSVGPDPDPSARLHRRSRNREHKRPHARGSRMSDSAPPDCKVLTGTFSRHRTQAKVGHSLCTAVDGAGPSTLCDGNVG